MKANGTRAMIDVGNGALTEHSLKSRATPTRPPRQIHYQGDVVKVVQGNEADLPVVTAERDGIPGRGQCGALNAEIGAKLALDFHVGNSEARQTTLMVDHHKRFAIPKKKAGADLAFHGERTDLPPRLHVA